MISQLRIAHAINQGAFIIVGKTYVDALQAHEAYAQCRKLNIRHVGQNPCSGANLKRMFIVMQ